MTFPVVGQRFGRYLVDAFVAEGGMGAVFRARDSVLGRTVALKVIRPDAPDQAARFLREARLAARLGHPNIVTIHDVDDVAGTPYLVMEWLEGEALSRSSNARPLSDRLRILGDIADAIAYAHEQGVIHRDVKPGNVVLESSGRAKLVDFGLARLRGDLSQDGASGLGAFHTSAGQILGTPAYMAPEQWATSEVTPAADQFSWGVVAFQWINGVHPKALVPSFPFADRGSTFPWSVEVTPALKAVVARTMELDPRARFADMRSVVVAFRAAIAGEMASASGGLSFVSGVATAAPVAHRASATPVASAGGAAAFVPASATPALPPRMSAEARARSSVGDVVFFFVLFGIAGVGALYLLRPGGTYNPGGTYTSRSTDFNVVYLREDAGVKVVASAEAAPASSASPPPPPPRRAVLRIEKVGSKVRRVDVTAQLEASRAGIEACYASVDLDAEATDAPPHEVTYHVNPDGTVLYARHPGSFDLSRCVEGVLRKMRYPPTPSPPSSIKNLSKIGDDPYAVRFTIALE